MNTVEKLSVNLFDKMFDRDLNTRIEALKSEYNELIESFKLIQNEKNPLSIKNFRKELADVQSVITHITSIVHDSFESQLLYTNDKLLSRIEISKYRGKEYLIKGESK